MSGVGGVAVAVDAGVCVGAGIPATYPPELGTLD